jgi:hypothetical protein
MVASSSFFRRWAELVAPVSGWVGGDGTFRGGDRVNVFAEDAALTDLDLPSKTENGSFESTLDWGGGAVGNDDSKKEKSASAHASMLDSTCAGTEAG